jgi:hypothetical protein
MGDDRRWAPNFQRSTFNVERSRAARSRNPIGSHVGLQRFGNENRSVFLLMRFDEGDIEARQRSAGTIQGVTESVFSVLVFEAQLHTASLVVFEI